MRVAEPRARTAQTRQGWHPKSTNQPRKHRKDATCERHPGIKIRRIGQSDSDITHGQTPPTKTQNLGFCYAVVVPQALPSEQHGKNGNQRPNVGITANTLSPKAYATNYLRAQIGAKCSETNYKIPHRWRQNQMRLQLPQFNKAPTADSDNWSFEHGRRQPAGNAA